MLTSVRSHRLNAQKSLGREGNDVVELDSDTLRDTDPSSRTPKQVGRQHGERLESVSAPLSLVPV